MRKPYMVTIIFVPCPKKICLVFNISTSLQLGPFISINVYQKLLSEFGREIKKNVFEVL